MKDLLKLSTAEMARKLQAGEVTSVELTQTYLDRIHAVDERVHTFLSVDGEDALAAARDIDARRAAGESSHRFTRVPIAVRDGMVTRGKPATCASKILEGWLPPYDATAVERLHGVGLPIVGKANMDELAMGSSTEHSAYGEMHNLWDLDRIPGGSSGGPAAAVSAFMVPWALGSGTSGSIRQPTTAIETVGAKPTYGGVSRYDLAAMASSLDQVGPPARNVADTATLQEIVGGHDPCDSTPLNAPVPPFEEIAAKATSSAKPLEGVRMGMVKQLGGEGCQEGVVASFQEALKTIEDSGAQVVEISCPSLEYALGACYLIMPTKISSSLARFDDMRYGIRIEPEEEPVTAGAVMVATRGAGFGPEVKRRTVLGTRVLSSGYYDAYYGSAQKVRTLVQRDFDAAFGEADVLVSLVLPVAAWKLGSKLKDPLTMYVLDVTTTPTNLAGIPGISIPNGLADNLPVGFQILAPAHINAQMYRVADTVKTGLGKPLAESCPATG